MTCEHWDIEAGRACERPAVVRVTATDEGETWTGWLCQAHFDAYHGDPEIDVVVGDA
jgi:hypothetical protein